MFDAIVIGGGPAGLSAALWLGRYRRSTLLVDAGEPRNRWAQTGHGLFPSDGFDPIGTLEEGRHALGRYTSVEIRDARVSEVYREDGAFVVRVDDKDVASRSIVLATGVLDRFPEVANLEVHYGASVFTCPACDGFEARGTDSLVIGWSEEITAFALSLLNWARTVTIVTEDHRFEANAAQRRQLSDAGITIIEDDAIEFTGRRGALEGAVLRRTGLLPCQTAFFSIDTLPVNGFARSLGCQLREDGCIVTDADGMTSVEGVYAAGDVTPGPDLVLTAAAEGTVAGIACAKAIGRTKHD